MNVARSTPGVGLGTTVGAGVAVAPTAAPASRNVARFVIVRERQRSDGARRGDIAADCTGTRTSGPPRPSTFRGARLEPARREIFPLQRNLEPIRTRDQRGSRCWRLGRAGLVAGTSLALPL